MRAMKDAPSHAIGVELSRATGRTEVYKSTNGFGSKEVLHSQYFGAFYQRKGILSRFFASGNSGRRQARTGADRKDRKELSGLV
jgi:hypothetical protein